MPEPGLNLITRAHYRCQGGVGVSIVEFNGGSSILERPDGGGAGSRAPDWSRVGVVKLDIDSETLDAGGIVVLTIFEDSSVLERPDGGGAPEGDALISLFSTTKIKKTGASTTSMVNA